jgi:phosphomannomutase
MLSFMKSLSQKITVGIVGGSDLPKQEEQLGEGIVDVFPYNFSQNGLVAYKDGELQEVQTISKFLGEDNVKRIVNWTMKYLAEIDIPVKVSEIIRLARVKVSFLISWYTIIGSRNVVLTKCCVQ